jgi:integrase
MRYAGARRAEVGTIRIDDVDRHANKLRLQTKGHRKGDIEYLPVVLYPSVAAQLWTYFTEYRPTVSNTIDNGQLFLSHGLHDYGRPLTDSAIRELFDRLRPALSPQWRRQATPHTLRHACAYELQGRVSPDAIMAQMRHRSTRSLDPYRASALVFADQLLPTVGASVREMMTRVGLGG